MWNLKRKQWLKSTYLLSKNRATGVETENYGYKGGKGGVNWETGADIHTHCACVPIVSDSSQPHGL